MTGHFPPSQEPVAITVTHLVDELVRRGHRPLVLTAGVGPASYRGVRVVRVREGDAAAVTRELVGYRPDLVHVADPRLLGLVALASAHRLGVPAVVTHHSVAPGHVADWLGRHGVPTLPWRSGVDTDLYRPEMRSPALSEKWSTRGRLLVVGHVGAVDRPRVRRRLAEVGRLTGVRLVAVRATAGAESLRAKVPGAKVLGDVSGIDLAHAVASYDVLLQPRRKELDCHGVRRALASGVPVVGFAAGGVPDLVTHGVNGLLVDPRQPHGMRDAVASLVGDPGLVTRLAGPARASVSGRTWTHAVDELLAVHWAGLLPPRASSG